MDPQDKRKVVIVGICLQSRPGRAVATGAATVNLSCITPQRQMVRIAPRILHRAAKRFARWSRPHLHV